MTSKLKVLGCKYNKDCPQDKGKTKPYTCCNYCGVWMSCHEDEQCNCACDECDGVISITRAKEQAQQFMKIFEKQYTGFYLEEDEYRYIHYPSWAIEDAFERILNGELDEKDSSPRV